MKVKSLGVEKYIDTSQEDAVVVNVTLNNEYLDTSLAKTLPCNLLIDTLGNLKEFYSYKPSAGSYIKFGASYIMDKTEFGGFLTFFEKLRAFFHREEVLA